MRRDIVTSGIAIVLLTVVLGLAYPLAMTGLGQLAFHSKANGSQIAINGKVVGSRLLGQPFVIDTGRKDSSGKPITRPDLRYFQPRPSADGYNAAGTYFSNRGPNQKSAKSFHRDELNAYLSIERPYDPGLTAKQVPVDAVTTSASGVDPQISPANAAVQAHRIARVRHLSLDRVMQLVHDHTDRRFLGVLGEDGVNVLELNLALDRLP
jgi:potassium-transporting ATPase KdpC subunit